MAGRPYAGDAAPRRHRDGVDGVDGADAVDLVQNQKVEPGSVVRECDRFTFAQLQLLQLGRNVAAKRHSAALPVVPRHHLHGEAGIPDVLDGTHLRQGVAIFC